MGAAWDEVTPLSLRNSWKKLLPLPATQEDAETVPSCLNEDFVQQFSQLNIEVSSDQIQKWMESDGPGHQHLNDQEIVNLVSNHDLCSNEEIEDDEDPADTSDQQLARPTHAEALQFMDGYLRWYQHLPNATAANVSALVRFRELAAEMRESSRKQPTIDSFFSRVARKDN